MFDLQKQKMIYLVHSQYNQIYTNHRQVNVFHKHFLHVPATPSCALGIPSNAVSIFHLYSLKTAELRKNMEDVLMQKYYKFSLRSVYV